MDLHESCFTADPESALQATRALLELGASPEDLEERRGEDGATALTLACRRGHAEVCALLLKTGASANAAGLNGKSPLWWATAAARGKEGDRLCEMLSAAGAEPLPQGEIPIDASRESAAGTVNEVKQEGSSSSSSSDTTTRRRGRVPAASLSDNAPVSSSPTSTNISAEPKTAPTSSPWPVYTLGALTAICYALMCAILLSTEDGKPLYTLDTDMTWTFANVQARLDANLGPKGVEKHLRLNLVDHVFPLFYAPLLALLHARRGNVRVMVALSLLAGLMDMVENRVIRDVLLAHRAGGLSGSRGSSSTSRMYLVTPAKFGVLAVPALVLAGQELIRWLCGTGATGRDDVSKKRR